MTLVIRRTLATAIDALVILLLLLPVFMLAATVLWLFGKAERHSAYEITLAVAFAFALMGSLSIGWLPTLGKRLAKIHLVSADGGVPSRLRLLLRLLLFFFAPTAFLYGSNLVGKVASLSDPNARDLLVGVALFATYLASFLLPASVVATRGSEGLHDRVTGIRVESHHSKTHQRLPTRVIAGRAFIIATALSVLATSLFVGTWIAAGVSPANLETTAKKDPGFALLDKLLPVEEHPCRSFVITYSKKLWADLKCGTSDGESTTKHGVPNGPYEGKVLGVAYELGVDTIPLYLVALNRRDERVIPAGTPIFTAYMFLDSVAYHHGELAERLTSKLIKTLVREQVDTQFPVVQIKLARFVSVGTVTLGAHDSIFLHDGRVWRDSLVIDWPGILKFGSFYPPPRGYITELDVR